MARHGRAIDSIRTYYLDRTGRRQLTEKEEEIRQRLISAFTLLCERRGIKESVTMHMETWQVSEVTAYRDMNDAIKLFGNVIEADKRGFRWIIFEYCQETYQEAKAAKDHKAMAQATKNMIKLLGLDRDDPDIPNFEKLKPSMNVIVLPEEVETNLREMLKAGAVNLNDVPKTIDISYEDETEPKPGTGAEKGD